MSASKKYTKKKTTEKQVKEPIATYQTDKSKELRIYNSFEEAEEAEYQYLASLSGEEHLANAVAWIKRLYAKELMNTKKSPKKLYIDTVTANIIEKANKKKKP